jgi:hypothetical protein
MISWEQDDDHVFDIGTREEVLKMLLNDLQQIVIDAGKTEAWQDFIYDMREYIEVMVDIDQNAESGHLIALTHDTPSGNLGWAYVNNIDIDDIL